MREQRIERVCEQIKAALMRGVGDNTLWALTMAMAAVEDPCASGILALTIPAGRGFVDATFQDLTGGDVEIETIVRRVAARKKKAS